MMLVRTLMMVMMFAEMRMEMSPLETRVQLMTPFTTFFTLMKVTPWRCLEYSPLKRIISDQNHACATNVQHQQCEHMNVSWHRHRQ
ncbi:hypothetical protein DPMN_175547 [Dreissena polymorpha]|uniref:Secreted protein n=1 Tax=Dreissena polymorpha TaxID=45954 RepID=A0A9D4E6T6_DREPO|nr:hypothetical protein DPMN_175547 [Dreissena polymorpha]